MRDGLFRQPTSCGLCEEIREEQGAVEISRHFDRLSAGNGRQQLVYEQESRYLLKMFDDLGFIMVENVREIMDE